LIWTEIDIQGKWLDTTSEDTLSEALKAKISIPSEAKPNFRTFNYVFKVSNHRLYFESLNEFNEGLGPKTARSMFSRLLSRELLGEKFPDISVTILPNERAVEKVLTLPGLRSLTIRINTPNADASDPEARKRVLDEMRAAKARQRDEHWVKNSEAKTLLPTADIRERATVAAETGFVRGEGRDSNGKNLLAATDDYPQRFFVDNSVGESFFERLKTSLGSLL
jgi:hypothetical protein